VGITKLPLWIGLSARKSRNNFLFLNIFILFLKLPQFTVSAPQFAQFGLWEISSGKVSREFYLENRIHIGLT